MWGAEPRSKLTAGQGMSQIIGQRASPCIVPASGFPCLTLLGTCFLEPGLLQVSSPSMTKYETRETRTRGTWLPQTLPLQLGPRAPSRPVGVVLTTRRAPQPEVPILGPTVSSHSSCQTLWPPCATFLP